MTWRYLKMLEVVVCDTNVVIQLAIICPDALVNKHANLRLVVPSLVKTEIQQLKLDAEKMKRIGKVLDFILKNVVSPMKPALPNQGTEKKLHAVIRIAEASLEPSQISAGSSNNDRKLLIIAYVNKTKLMTNEKTLFSLSEALLGTDRVWKAGHCLEYLLANKIQTQKDIQAGIDRLKPLGEYLSSDCRARVVGLGLVVP